MTPLTKPIPIPALITVPATWLVIDIETGNAPEEAVALIAEDWRPPKNIRDPDKIAVRREEKHASLHDRAALLDESPILCIALKTATTALIINGMDDNEYQCKNWQHLSTGTERNMLIALKVWLEVHTNELTTLVGHNIKSFDLPKLRQAYIRHRLRLPSILAPRVLESDTCAPVVDTSQIIKAYSIQHRNEWCPSLDQVATCLRITRPKALIKGQDVPALHKIGEISAILTYCAIDAETTARAYTLMSNQSNDCI